MKANLKTIINRSLLVTSIMLASMMLVACGGDPQAGAYRNFGSTGWLYDDTVTAVIPVDSARRIVPAVPVAVEDTVPSDTVAAVAADTASVVDPVVVADVAVGIRHTNAYPYSNLWVELTYQTPDTLRRDTFDIRLCDVYGNWYGHGVGVGYQVVDTLMRNQRIDASVPVTMRHIMRADTLREIQQAGILVTIKD